MIDKEILLYDLGRSQFPTFNPDPTLLPSTIGTLRELQFRFWTVNAYFILKKLKCPKMVFVNHNKRERV